MKLEVLSRYPATPSSHPPLLLVHGAFTNATCWEFFLEFFAEQGLEVHALSLRGHGQSEGWLDGSGVPDYVADIHRVAQALKRPPVLVGHSMGGYLAQVYARQHAVAGLVLMASLPPWGLGMVLSHMSVMYPWEWARFLNYSWLPKKVHPQDPVWQVILGQAPDPRLAARWEPQRESFRSALELSVPLLLPWAQPEVPVLVMGASGDKLISPSIARATALAYDAELQLFEMEGHAMMLDQQWGRVATSLQHWVTGSGNAAAA